MAKNINIKIGEVTIAIESDARINDWEITPAYRPFISNGNPDIRLQLHLGIPDLGEGAKVFDGSPIWNFYQQGDRSIIKLYQNNAGLEHILLVETDLTMAELFFTEANSLITNPFHGPSFELLMINYLARERGIIMHACGIDYDGRGILFVGESGAGKSTLSKLWTQINGVEIFSDDRVIVRKKHGEFWMYGTPWHGDAKFVSPRGVKLEHIYFLQHDKKNSVRTLKAVDSVLEFLKASFPPFWDAKGMEFSMDLFNDLANAVPCEGLSFKPDKSVIELVSDLL